MKRFLWVIAGVLLIGCREESAPAPRSVLFAVVEMQDQEPLGQFVGTIQARHQTVLAFRVGGRVAYRYVNAGEKVQAGVLLAELDPSEQLDLLHAREGEQADLSARYDNALAALQRQRQLLDSGVGSKAQLQRLQTDATALSASREQARAAVRQARDRLSYSRLYSEHEGVVIVWYAEAGQTVAPGQNVLGLTQSQEREAVVDLPATLVESLPSSAQWRITAQVMSQVRATGLVREVAPQLDTSTRSRRVRLSLQDASGDFRLGTHVTVSVSAPVSRRSNLPETVLFQRDGHYQVWLVDPRSLTAAPRVVQVLAHQGGRVTIGEGLNEGDIVVAAGLGSVQTGQRISLEQRVQ